MLRMLLDPCPSTSLNRSSPVQRVRVLTLRIRMETRGPRGTNHPEQSARILCLVCALGNRRRSHDEHQQTRKLRFARPHRLLWPERDGHQFQLAPGCSSPILTSIRSVRVHPWDKKARRGMRARILPELFAMPLVPVSLGFARRTFICMTVIRGCALFGFCRSVVVIVI